MKEVLPLTGIILLSLGLIAGIAMTVVGLRRKRHAMWAGGIVICLLGGLTIYIGSVFIHAESRRQIQAVKDEWAREDIKTWTGLHFPQVISVKTHHQHGVQVQNRVKELSTYHLSVPPDFDRYLQAEFTGAQWPDVDWIFAASRLHPQQTLPTDAKLQATRLYTAIRPRPLQGGKSTTAVAYDPNSRQAWVVIVFESTSQ
jgi:hypothetical protein